MNGKTGLLIGGLFFLGVIVYFLTKPSTPVTTAQTGTDPSTSNSILGFGTALLGVAGKLIPQSANRPAANNPALYPGVGQTTGQNYVGPSYYPNSVTDENGYTSGSGVADGGT